MGEIKAEGGICEQHLCASSRVNRSFSQLHTLPGRAKISLRAPSMSKVANVVGRLEKKKWNRICSTQFNTSSKV